MSKYKKYYTLDTIALFISSLVTIAAFAQSILYFSQKANQTEKEFIKERFVNEKYIEVFNTDQSKGNREIEWSDEQTEKVERLIEVRKENYINNNENLNLLTQLLMAFLILGALILFYDPDEFRMPFVEVTIPATLFHLFVAFGMVYLWIQFGLALNTGVDGRLALDELIKQYENVVSAKISPAYSEVYTLADKGIVDAWSHWYYQVFDTKTHGPFHDVISWLGLYIVYGGFWGGIHAVAIMLSTTIYEKKRYKRGGKLLLVLFILTMILLVAAGVTFIVEFPHAGRLMGTTWLISTISLIYWIRWGRSIAADKSENAKEG